MSYRFFAAVAAFAAVATVAGSALTSSAEARSGTGHVPYGVNGADPDPHPASNGPPVSRAPATSFRGIRNFSLIDGEPIGFGNFNKRADASYRTGERVVVYGEPVGFGWSARGSGYHFQLFASIEIRDRGGRVVWTAPRRVNLENSAERQTSDFYFHVFLELPNLSPGAYVVHYKFDDPQARTFVNFERNITVTSDRTTDAPAPGAPPVANDHRMPVRESH